MAHMLALWRRHSRSCPHRKKGRTYIKCKCMIWVDGELNGKRFRRSTGVRDWQRALRKVAAWESPNAPILKPVKEATKAFLVHSRDLSPASLKKYGNVLRRLQEFCQRHHIDTLSELTVETLDEYRAQRKIGALTATKELQTLRQFCEFCMRRKWLAENPAKQIRPPKNVKSKPVEPYSPAEVAQIIVACDEFGRGQYERLRALAMILVMRYTALRISDVVKLSRDRIRDGYMHLHTTKNSGKVLLPVPVELQRALEQLPVPRGASRGCPYFFWNGHTNPEVLKRKALRTLKAVFEAAGVANAHSHRFRHTLATEILSKGGTEQVVADVLGISAAVVRKHYAKWSVGRQELVIRVLESVFGQVYEREPAASKPALAVQ